MIRGIDIEDGCWEAASEGSIEKLRAAAYILMKERDAYREVAINLGGHESTIDSEAVRIMKEKV